MKRKGTRCTGGDDVKIAAAHSSSSSLSSLGSACSSSSASCFLFRVDMVALVRRSEKASMGEWMG